MFRLLISSLYIILGEKFGNASKTEVSADFKDLIKETDERKEHTERVHKACLSFVMSMSKFCVMSVMYQTSFPVDLYSKS